MFKKIKLLFNQYREYIRVDFIMYGVLIGMIIIYFIFSMLQML
ncbi:MAG TPA: hypothetical protein VIN08_14495 [Ohtaekwangia sp.]